MPTRAAASAVPAEQQPRDHQQRDEDSAEARKDHARSRLRRAEQELEPSLFFVRGPAVGQCQGEGGKNHDQEREYPVEERPVGDVICPHELGDHVRKDGIATG